MSRPSSSSSDVTRRAVEAVPAEPENEHAKRTEGYRVAGDGVDLDDLSALVADIFTEPRSEEYRADQRRDAADHVYRAGAGKVVKSKLTEPAAAPYPVRFYRVDKQRDDSRIYAVGGKFRALSHSAGNYRCGGCAENKVEYEYGRAGEAAVCGGGYKCFEG